jgi:hypothetical protein
MGSFQSLGPSQPRQFSSLDQIRSAAALWLFLLGEEEKLINRKWQHFASLSPSVENGFVQKSTSKGSPSMRPASPG